MRLARANNYYAIYSNTRFEQGIIEFYGTIPTGGQTGTYTYAFIGLGSGTPVGIAAAVGDFNTGSSTPRYGLTTSTAQGASNFMAGLSFGQNNVYSIQITLTAITAQVNYHGTITSNVDLPTLPQPIIFVNQANSGITIGPIYWIRERAFPPNGVPPSVTIGNVAAIPEFPSITVLPLFMTATLLAVVAYRRKHTLR